MERTSNILVSSPNLKYTDDFIFADYEYEETLVTKKGDDLVVSGYLLCFTCSLPVLPVLFVLLIGIFSWNMSEGCVLDHQNAWRDRSEYMQIVNLRMPMHTNARKLTIDNHN